MVSVFQFGYPKIFYRKVCSAIKCPYGKVFQYLGSEPLKTCRGFIFSRTEGLQPVPMLQTDHFNQSSLGVLVFMCSIEVLVVVLRVLVFMSCLSLEATTKRLAKENYFLR